MMIIIKTKAIIPQTDQLQSLSFQVFDFVTPKNF